MKTQLLIVVGLLFFLPNLFAQENSFQDNHFKESFLSQRKQYLPHIQINEMGYYYVDMEFIHPNDDRSDKPVLEGYLYSVVNASGDTTYTLKQFYTISDDNRLSKIEYEYNFLDTNSEIEKSFADYTYEYQGDSLILEKTTYIINDNGVSIPSEKYVLITNSDGLVSSYFWQQYSEDQWVNTTRRDIEFNEFNCKTIETIFYWQNNIWSQIQKEIGYCDDELLLRSEYYWGENEIYSGYVEYGYDMNQNIVSRLKFLPTDEDPNIIEERFLDIYSFNEENLLDSVKTFEWNAQEKEFFITRYYTIGYSGAY